MKPKHPYQTTLDQIRATKGGGYASLNDQQRREWHADVYAFRRVYMGRDPSEPPETTSPVDPSGEWFDPLRIEICERYHRAELAAAERRREAGRSVRRMLDAEMILEGRDLCNRWAKQNGFVDFPAAERAGYKHSDVVKAIFAAKAPRPVKGFGTLAGAMGVKAREFTPEDMAKGRAKLGLESDEAAREESPH